MYCQNDLWFRRLYSIVLLIFMTISRGGLFLLDASVNQIIIENVKSENISILIGQSDSLHQTAVFVINISATIFSEAKYFGIFSIWSILNICISSYIQTYAYQTIKNNKEEEYLLDNEKVEVKENVDLNTSKNINK